jgi:hypothetical protein
MPVEIHRLSALDALASLKSARTGLSRAEAERRLQEFGLNEIEKVAGEPLGTMNMSCLQLERIINASECSDSLVSISDIDITDNKGSRDSTKSNASDFVQLRQRVGAQLREHTP